MFLVPLRVFFRKPVLPYERFLWDARCLLWLGFPTPAAMSARVALERFLRFAAKSQGVKFKARCPFWQLLDGLEEQGLLERQDRKAISKMNKSGNLVAHGNPIPRRFVVEYIRKVREFCNQPVGPQLTFPN